MTDDKKKIFSKEEALALARQGKDAWNEWAKDNSGIEIDFSNCSLDGSIINFSNFIFPGPCNFYRSTFFDMEFWNAKFLSNVKFDHSRFEGPRVNFYQASFLGDETRFNYAKFVGGNYNFLLTKFDGKYIDFSDAEFIGRSVGFTDTSFIGTRIRFERTKFTKSDAHFFGAKFCGDISFNLAKFGGEVANFENTWFLNGAVSFKKAMFSGSLIFSNAKFDNESSFEGARFDGPIDLENSKFTNVPDFRKSKLATHFSLHDMTVNEVFKPVRKLFRLRFKEANDASVADKFRRLKELAVQARDHEREQDFFAKELKAKRFYETTGPALGWSYLYEWTSNFGLSTSRPIYWLLATWFCFGAVYGAMSTILSTHPFEALGKGLILSGALLTPFVAISRTAISDMRESLYGDGISLWWLDVAAIFQGILGLIFIFLIGLALRNRFRI